MSKTPARPSKVAPRKATPELIRDALAYIPPDVDRDTWARLAMAIKSEMASSSGFELWNDWSAKGETYDERNARDTWRSIKAGGATTIGTLFGIAKGHGFRFPEDAAAQAVQTPAQLAAAAAEAERLVEEKRRQRDAEAAEYRRRADKAARDAVSLWMEANESGNSPYLVRKGVQAHGVRILSDGTLLVPMRDQAGELLNVQRIAPERPAGDAPEKRFLPGGRKSGLWHLIGSLEGAAVLLLAEGYATAASLHEATGRPVAVCFDAGNLVNVAKALCGVRTDLPLLVCGDDDSATAARTGKNPGRDKAASAVRAVRSAGGWSAAVFPAGLAGGATDFNDLCAQAGAGAVRSIIEEAVRELTDGMTAPASERSAQARSTPTLRVVAGGKGNVTATDSRGAEGQQLPGESRDPGGDRGDRGDGGDGGDGAPAAFDPFSLNDAGVWHSARDAEGNEKRPAWLCSRLVVTARTRAEDANGWGCLLEFSDPDGNPKSWAMPSSMLSGEGAEWAGRLRDMGLQMAPGTRARNLLAQYIDTRQSADRVTCTDRVGWHGPVYVLPSSCVASVAVAGEGRRYVFQSETGMEDTFRRAGTLEDWQTSVAAPAAGNSRFVFSIAFALAGAVLRPAGVESGGAHWRGDSSIGKTAVLRVATSVWGRPTFMQRWRTTSNALEATAVQHCDATLILDEFGQLDPREAGDVAYLLSNEQEKGRSTGRGYARRKRTWRLLFLSSGEVSLSDHMAEAGKRTRAGMEVRMLDIPLDAGAGMGGLETIHDHEGPGAFVEWIVANAARCYGTAGRAWIEWCCEHFAELPELLQGLIERYRNDLVPEAASEQVRRAGTRFALVAAAGELATQAGITGWTDGEALRASRTCFNAWLGARGHLDNGEDASMLRQVRNFLELNGEGRFAWWHRAMDDHTPKTLNRAGFRRLLDSTGKPIKSDTDHQREYGERISSADAESVRVDYIVMREVFEREVCRSYDPRSVAKLLMRRGHLQGEGDRLMDRQRLPGMGGDKVPCYHIKPSLFTDDL